MFGKIKVEHLFIVCMFVLFVGFIIALQNNFEAQKKMMGVPPTPAGDIAMGIGLDNPNRKIFYRDPSLGSNPFPPLTYLFSWSMAKNNLDSFFISIEQNALSDDGIVFVLSFMMFCSLMFLFQLSNLKTGRSHIKFLSTLPLMFSSNFLFAFYSGNPIILATVFLTFFIVNYKNEKGIVRELAILSLALAVTLKPYICFMGILLLFDKEWKLLIRAAIFSILLIFIPFFFVDLPPEVYANGIMDKFFTNIIRWIDILLSHTDGMSFPANIGPKVFTPEIRAVLKDIIYAISVILSVLAIVCAPFLKGKDEWKKILLMICSFILLADGGTVNLYCLIYLSPCIIMFLNSNTKINLSNMIYLIGFVLILNPLQIGKVSGITITWALVKIGFWIVFIHMIFDGFRELLKEKDWRKRIWFLNTKEKKLKVKY